MCFDFCYYRVTGARVTCVNLSNEQGSPKNAAGLHAIGAASASS